MFRNSQFQILISFVWAGMVIAISFLEAPVKFTTPSLSREVALDVGQTVFSALNQVEWVLAALLSGLVLFWAQPKWVVYLYTGVILCLFIQSFWLLPELKLRAAMIISGIEPAPSYHHLSYGVIEILKLSILLTLGFKKFNQHL